MKRISIVVPCYNEAPTIARVVADVQNVTQTLSNVLVVLVRDSVVIIARLLIMPSVMSATCAFRTCTAGSARTMKKGVEVLKPYLSKDATSRLGTAIIGTVKGDMHDIGKNLVAMMMESAGFEVVDLEVDVPYERFEEALSNHENVRIIALSTLLTTTMPAMKRIVEGLNQLENRDSFRIMVGGAPITEAFARQIGADGYSADAAAAAVLAKSLVS